MYKRTYKLLCGQLIVLHLHFNLVIRILYNSLAGQALYLSHADQDKDHNAILHF
jgi:hypothetical protein